MLLLLHILIALSGLVTSTLAVLRPSRNKINLSYGLVLATIASGTALVILDHARILSSCITGLVYIGVSLTLILSAQRRMVASRINSQD
jgi:hypothetical protein